MFRQAAATLSSAEAGNMPQGGPADMAATFLIALTGIFACSFRIRGA